MNNGLVNHTESRRNGPRSEPSSFCHEPIYLLPEPNFPRWFCDACQFTSYDRTEFHFTSFGSVAEPIYLLPEAPSQFVAVKVLEEVDAEGMSRA
eukprot:SAG25_NODE_448_length_7916_cov_6.846105_2_plen_94_part_00